MQIKFEPASSIKMDYLGLSQRIPLEQSMMVIMTLKDIV